LSNVKKHQDIVYLARLSLRSGRNVVHHFVQVGGTLFAPEKESGFIQGLDKETASAMTPDTETLFASPHADTYQVATRESIMNCTSIDKIEALQDSTTQTFCARNFVPIPPFFLIRPIVSAIAANKGDAKKVILLDVISAIKEFNTLHGQDELYTEKAATRCRPFSSLVAQIQSSRAQGNLLEPFKILENDHLAKEDRDPFHHR
jgi:hypothetical protein